MCRQVDLGSAGKTVQSWKTMSKQAAMLSCDQGSRRRGTKFTVEHPAHHQSDQSGGSTQCPESTAASWQPVGGGVAVRTRWEGAASAQWGGLCPVTTPRAWDALHMQCVQACAMARWAAWTSLFSQAKPSFPLCSQIWSHLPLKFSEIPFPLLNSP